MKYRLLLYEGEWEPRLSRRRIHAVLDDLSDGDWTVIDYAFMQPEEEDVAFAVELWIDSRWADAEHVRDAIIEKFLRHFEPEFETMIEIETMMRG